MFLLHASRVDDEESAFADGVFQCSLCNHFFTTGSYLYKWKAALIKPHLRKAGTDVSWPANFSPILNRFKIVSKYYLSLLPSISWPRICPNLTPSSVLVCLLALLILQCPRFSRCRRFRPTGPSVATWYVSCIQHIPLLEINSANVALDCKRW